MLVKILALLEHQNDLDEISESLEHVGHQVLKATQFQEAMEILRKTDVDLIIADVHLQNGGSIFDFLRWVKGDPHMRLVPFVCFSAQATEIPKYLADGVRTAARAMGAARYITMETFDKAAFLAEIEWLLPQDRAGNHYAEQGRDGDNKPKSPGRLKKEKTALHLTEMDKSVI
ncbi:MAG: hypothetical protein K2X81_29645 [Candidatus Obscuribacterales bacterium]|nr:hypothetical protein [Candidatus Obscuribacterales bacterium]